MNQTPSLPPVGSHFIPLNRAIEMTSLFRSHRENVLAPVFQNQDILPVCETFNRADIDTLLGKEQCQALRVYFGMDESLKVRVIMIAANGNGEDILPAQSTIGPDLDNGEDIVEEGHRCPPACPPPSPLNN